MGVVLLPGMACQQVRWAARTGVQEALRGVARTSDPSDGPTSWRRSADPQRATKQIVVLVLDQAAAALHDKAVPRARERDLELRESAEYAPHGVGSGTSTRIRYALRDVPHNGWMTIDESGLDVETRACLEVPGYLGTDR